MQEFLWGVASSAFQTEGHINNDMTEWEKQGGFAKDGKNPLYGQAANHWNLWESDFDLLQNLNVNAYRFSIEWARVEPQPGQFSQQALDCYERMVDRLLEMNIVPMLTLHHFTHPRWFHKHSPWVSDKSTEVFCTYSHELFKRLSDRVPLWISFNEPLVWALAAYGDARFPPGKRDLNLVMKALHNMLLTHRCVYDQLKSFNPRAHLGIAKHFITFKAGRSWFLPDKGIANALHQFFNTMVMEAFTENRLRFRLPGLLNFDEPVSLDNKIDFWGINYYYRMHARLKLSLKQPFLLYFKNARTDMGWEIYPRGLKTFLDYLKKSGKDIYITENGIATTDDELRIFFMKEHVHILRKALKKNPKIKGYFYWSFLDNYEWLEGISKRFGLVKVDYEDNYKRYLKHSAEIFSNLRNTIQTIS